MELGGKEKEMDGERSASPQASCNKMYERLSIHVNVKRWTGSGHEVGQSSIHSVKSVLVRQTMVQTVCSKKN